MTDSVTVCEIVRRIAREKFPFREECRIQKTKSAKIRKLLYIHIKNSKDKDKHKNEVKRIGYSNALLLLMADVNCKTTRAADQRRGDMLPSGPALTIAYRFIDLSLMLLPLGEVCINAVHYMHTGIPSRYHIHHMNVPQFYIPHIQLKGRSHCRLCDSQLFL